MSETNVTPRRYYNYKFECPTKDFTGEIKNFTRPIDENHCPMCGRAKGTNTEECNYTLINF